MKSRSQWVWLAVFAGLASAGVASAAVAPGTPVEVAAGVPGHGRTWEVVTPEEVSSAFLLPSEFAPSKDYVSNSGERVVFQAVGKLPDAPEQEFLSTENYSTRGDGGWDDAWLFAPNFAYFPTLVDVDPALDETLWTGRQPNGEEALFRASLDGTFTTLVSFPASKPNLPLSFVGASEDLSRVFFATAAHLLPADAARTSGTSLYEVDAAGARLADVDAAGQPISDCGSTEPRLEEGTTARLVSANGRRVFFTANPGCAGPAEAFMREDGTKTVEISASQCDLADCGPESDVRLLGATADGESAYLATAERLTDEDTDSAESLYRYDVASGNLTLLTPSAAKLGEFRSLTPCDDGSRAYFAASGESGSGLFLAGPGGLQQIVPAFPSSPLQVSADGRYAAFVTSAALDPRDTDSSPDVYRFDAATGKSTLVSVGQVGGEGSVAASLFGEYEGALKTASNQPARAMSEGGNEVFFQTPERLLAEDRNEVSDVYEWDEGSLSLISSGTGEAGSFFLGANAAGSTAFFETADTLVPRDRDGGERDIYTARIGGGFPEPAPPAGCQGGSCHGTAPSASPRPAARSTKGPRHIVIGPVDSAALRRIAASGRIDLLVEAPRQGRLSARATAKLGGHSRVVAETGMKVAAPGPLLLRMRLSPAARELLAAGHDLRLKVGVRLGEAKGGVRLLLRSRPGARRRPRSGAVARRLADSAAPTDSAPSPSVVESGPAATTSGLVISPGSVGLQTLDAAGQPDSRAGSHPDRLVQGIQIEQTGVEEDVKQLVIRFTAGVSGDTGATPFCPRATIQEIEPECPADTQVGVFLSGSEPSQIFNVAPGPNEAVTFGVGTRIPFLLSGRLRPGDQGLTLSSTRIDPLKSLGAGLDAHGGTIELWGVPADHQTGVGSPLPRRALLTTPTRCGEPLTSLLEVRTWQNPETLVTSEGSTHEPLTGCSELPFDPSLHFELGNPRADSPTGTRIAIAMPPEPTDPSSRAQSQIEGLKVDFPAGMSVSLGAAAGIGVCSDAQFGLDSEADPSCPPSAKIGSLELKLPALGRPLPGAIYLGQERPGERFPLLLAAAAPGSSIKLAGTLRADPATGRMSASLRDLPQAPFEEISLNLDGGPGALLATPLGCGTATATATLTPYSGTAAARREAKAALEPTAGGLCTGAKLPFSPRFEGGSTNARAGQATGFTTTVTRADGEGLTSRVEVPLPEGMSADLGGVPLCGKAVADAGACPGASRIGSAVAQLGPGPQPATIDGGIYLTGPYRHGPYGLAIAFRGAVGPFDLGELVVRAALQIDSKSGQVTVVTDPLPTSVEGIPVRFRQVGLDLDRKGFLHNPTGCSARKLTASFRSVEGASATASTPFAISGCVDLPFKPKFSLALEGRSQLHAEGRPGLRIAAKLPAGGANLRSSKIVLPRLFRFTGRGALALCARGAALEGHCGKDARIGTAEGHTPLLKKPMKGYVYSVQPKGKGAPAIWVELRGGGIEVQLRGGTSTEHGHKGSKHGHPVTTLAGIPDFPLSSFQMDIRGGKHGPLVLSGNACGRRLRASLQLIGQNAAERRPTVPIAVPCGRHG